MKGEIELARIKRVAVVYCQGGDRAKRRVDTKYASCQEALEAVPDGMLECSAGCIGMGSCESACRLDAIHVGKHGVAVVDRSKCVGCGLCVKACPQSLIRLVDADMPIAPLCSTRLPGKEARDACASGCISCRICEKACPVNAITIQDGHAVINPEKCISCGMCAVKCPRGVIVDADGIFTQPAAVKGEV